ncbi:RNA polymerase sigma factor [Nocardioides alcanivorans]|uniref:RNA polymerase sigma factor n=1 Tax=Nocardioides alcanivorans TaxID=2897352 RepID=UPI001F1FD645|nr:sigma-70 family RNA polymerase sigma factor [Nocardioides alcanivorans]
MSDNRAGNSAQKVQRGCYELVLDLRLFYMAANPRLAVSVSPSSSSRLDISVFVADNRDHWVAYAYVLTGSAEAAQDAVHDVIERLLKKDMTEVLDHDAYARRAVANACSDSGRRRRRDRRRDEQLRAEWHRRHATQTDTFGKVEVLSALAALPHRQRAVVVLSYYLDLDDVDIADVVGLAPNSVRVVRSRALRKLRKILGTGGCQ